MNFGIMDPLIGPVVQNLSAAFIKIITALSIFLLGFILGKVLGRILFKMLQEIEINIFLKKTTGLRINADQIISSMITYAIYFLSIVAALEQIGIANIILYLLSSTIIIIILISFFLAIRDFLPNFLAGFYLYRQEKLIPGKNVEIDDIKGELQSIDLLQTKVLTKNKDLVCIPNSLVAKAKIKIKSK